jgi:uncharacterized membrane protein (UPF0127 family)
MRRPLRIGLAIVSVGLILGAAWIGPRLDVPVEFWLSPVESVSVESRELRVVRVGYAQGLRDVPTLGGLDGALFVLDAPTRGGMGMFDTRIPLDVVFFGSNGHVVDRFTMPVCGSDECPTYIPSSEWQFAIEAPAGSLGWITDAGVLVR